MGDSIFLHTFSVRRDKGGLGIGEMVIDRVFSIARERGLDKVRLDCFLSSTKLIAFYERNGFTSVGIAIIDGKVMNLMERDIQKIIHGIQQEPLSTHIDPDTAKLIGFRP